MIRFELHRPETLGPHVAALRRIEASISYPLDEDRFTIDHGADYGAFLSGLGPAYFLLPFEGDRLLGVIGACLRTLQLRHAMKALYIADLKLIPEARGGHVSRRLFAQGLRLLFTHPDARRLRLVFGAGMQGARGDVRTTFRKAHAGRLGTGLGQLRLYFIDREQLGAVMGDCPPLPAGIDLSGNAATVGPVHRNTGRKDFRLASTGRPWKLAHLPHPPGPGMGDRFRQAATQLAPDELACFAYDARLHALHGWLASQGLQSGAVCNLLGLAHPFLGRRPLEAPWLHLSTAEI